MFFMATVFNLECLSVGFEDIVISESQLKWISSLEDDTEFLIPDSLGRDYIVEIPYAETSLYGTWEILFTNTVTGGKTCGILQVRSVCDGTQAAVNLPDGKFVYKGNPTYIDIRDGSFPEEYELLDMIQVMSDVGDCTLDPENYEFHILGFRLSDTYLLQ